MGGKALVSGSVRLPASRYRIVAASIKASLRNAAQGARIEVIPAYATKPDFNVLEILIQSSSEYAPQALAKHLGAVEVVHNGDVTSLGVVVPEGVFQVDLIAIPPESFDFALRYFSYNDMGNLLGRIAHKFGAKLGHLGLQFPLRDPSNNDRLIAELTITRDFATALTLLGYDAKAYEVARSAESFKTLPDIFAFAIASPFVNKSIFHLDNRNHAARVRDAKRPTYSAFLQWLETQAPETLPAYPWGFPGSPQRTQQCQGFLERAFNASPVFKADYAATLASHHIKVLVHRQFNGERVSALTGLTGKALGTHMRLVRESFPTLDEFEQFFSSAPESQLESRILNPTQFQHTDAQN